MQECDFTIWAALYTQVGNKANMTLKKIFQYFYYFTCSYHSPHVFFNDSNVLECLVFLMTNLVFVSILMICFAQFAARV